MPACKKNPELATEINYTQIANIVGILDKKQKNAEIKLNKYTLLYAKTYIFNDKVHFICF